MPREKPRCVFSSGETQGQPDKSLKNYHSDCRALSAFHTPGTVLTKHWPRSHSVLTTAPQGCRCAGSTGKETALGEKWPVQGHTAMSGRGLAPIRAFPSVCVRIGDTGGLRPWFDQVSWYQGKNQHSPRRKEPRLRPSLQVFLRKGGGEDTLHIRGSWGHWGGHGRVTHGPLLGDRQGRLGG